MKSVKYIGLDVHQATISIAVLDANGKLVMQSIVATQASTILDFIHGVRGELHVTLEEGTAARYLKMSQSGRSCPVRLARCHLCCRHSGAGWQIRCGAVLHD